MTGPDDYEQELDALERALDAESVFSEFVERANRDGDAPGPDGGEWPSGDPTQPQVCLPEEGDPPTRPRVPSPPPRADAEPPAERSPRPSEQPESEADPWEPDSSEVVPLTRRKPGERTQRIEADRLVPEVAHVAPPPPPVPERSMDGQIPAGELDRILGDMEVLLRYGHRGQVVRKLEELLVQYPEDLLLLRRIAEFHIETDDVELAKERLFQLASRLFERRNIEGMWRALRQVQVIEPENARAAKLLALLEQRGATG